MPLSLGPNNSEPITALAQTNFRNQRRTFGIKKDDRRRHVYLIGKTGMGKSTVLENMIIQDIQAGEGVAVVDPHGDLVEKVVEYIPNERVNDVIYFNPADLDFPISFNVFEKVGREHQHLVASGLIGIFKKLWADSWGPRLEYVLRNAILALLEYPDSTLLGVMRLLVDKGYRKKVIQQVTDPVVRSFWIDEYSKYPDKFQSEAIAPIQNKVGQFLSSPVIRNIVGQVQSSFSMREAMDSKKILLMNLAKGRVGEDNSALLGAMLITKIQMAAMSRVDIGEETREDFYLYVDEFQNFATESFANILSEARKYRLNLIIAHQYIEQLDELVQAAVFGNVGTMMLFRIGGTDAEVLVKEFEPYFMEEDLVNLGKYEVYMKLMIDGIASQPFSAATLPPISGETDNREKVINVSRERYATAREVVEEKIMRWSEAGRESEDEEAHRPSRASDTRTPRHAAERPASIAPKPSIPRPAALSGAGREQASESPAGSAQKDSRPPKKDANITAICDICGNETALSFEPDGSRPIYCKSCLKKVRSGEIPRPEPKEEKKQREQARPGATKAKIPGSEPIDTAPPLSLSDALSQGVQKFQG
ncbi:MAG: type IV secretion system DNA-binding domain-containing protein [Patescibacteria group bacterium]|nr:type IV secretion system DNA-binding domain-containing protein [Patescibacteria group bacterium]